VAALAGPPPDCATAEPTGSAPVEAKPSPDEVLAQARAEAQAIRAQAQADAEGLCREARRQAEAEAAQTLARAYAEEQEAFRRVAEETLAELRAAQDERLAQVTEEAAALVAEMASRVVARLIAADEGIVVDVTRQALQELSEARELAIRVAPSAVPVLEARWEELRQELRADANATLIAAPEIAPGGCVVSSSHGEVDARIELQLDRCAEAVEEALAVYGRHAFPV
jgi:flagellar biosynthesis/type III secretory pathway protein FliH